MIEPIRCVDPCNSLAFKLLYEEKHEEIKYWEDLEFSLINPLKLYKVNLKSSEARNLLDMITRNSSKPRACAVSKIERIQNPHLMASYLLTKKSLIASYGLRVRSRTLLHGTPRNNVKSIIQDNFDLNAVKRHRYGKGVYFTTDIMLASTFSDKRFRKSVIVANVLQSVSCTGNELMEFPRGSSDTSENETPKNQKVIVKYHENTFCPKYVVTFILRNRSKNKSRKVLLPK